MDVSKLRQAAEKIHSGLTHAQPTFTAGVILLSLIAIATFYRLKRLTPDQIHARTFMACSGHPTHRRHVKARLYYLIRGDPHTDEQLEACVSLICSEICSDVSIVAAGV